LSVLQTSSSDLQPSRIWTPQRIDYPRYVLATDLSQGRFSLQPVFAGHLSVSRNSAWSADVWGLSSYVTIPNGTFVFTTSGLLAGLVIGQPDTPAIVPADTVISLAQRLLEEGQKPSGWLGIDVQPLTPQIRTATGMTSGVVVTWVDPQGPAAGKLVATDIIEVAGGHTLQTIADWEAGTTRLTAGGVITLRIWRNGRNEEVEITALPPRAASASSRLGLTMRVGSGVGAEVLSVEEGSVAMRAGIAVGDVLTRIGDIAAPTPAQVTGAFAAAKDRALLVAITRGTEHYVVGLVSQ
jgi:S1-C subfamily serine protease